MNNAEAERRCQALVFSKVALFAFLPYGRVLVGVGDLLEMKTAIFLEDKIDFLVYCID
jgi:hypothetical protein